MNLSSNSLSKSLELPLSSAVLKTFPQVFVQCPPMRHFTKVTWEEQNCSSVEPRDKHFEVQDNRSPTHLKSSGLAGARAAVGGYRPLWIKLSQVST